MRNKFIVAAGTALMLFSGTSWATEQAGAQSFEFNVYLGKRSIGTHRFDVYRNAGAIDRVESSASFDVRLLGVRIYRYRHQATEHWQQGCLRQLQSSTDDNGDHQKVDASPAGCVRSYAYWDPAMLMAASLLNPQTGQLDAVSFVPMGAEQLDMHGTSVQAVRHRLKSSAFTIDLWYTQNGQWVQLDSTTSDGRLLHYRLKPQTGVP